MLRKPNSCGSTHHQHCAMCHSRAEPLSSAPRHCGQWSQYVQLDGSLSMQIHVANVMQTCLFQLRRLRQIRRLLGRDISANVVAARDSTRLDCCNALLTGLRQLLSVRCSGSLRLPRGSCAAFGPMHHRAALAGDPRTHTVQAVAGRSSFIAELLQPVTTRHSSLQSAEQRPPRPMYITQVWGAGVQCWSRSLEQPSGRHSDYKQLLNLQKETLKIFIYKIF